MVATPPVVVAKECEGEELSSSLLMLETMTGRKPIHVALMENWQSGMTVAMVSVPLSISLGIASVAGDNPAAPTMGVATAFWGGITAGLFGSSDLNIVGPAGALSGMLKSYTIEFGDAGVLPYLSLVSAVIILAFWSLNLQRFLLLMPKAVFEGFTLAVAIVIGGNQVNMAFDLTPQGPRHEHFHENFAESLKVLPQLHVVPSAFFLVTVAMLLILVARCPQIRCVTVPWTVIIPLATIVFGYLANEGIMDVELPTLKSKYGTLEPQIIKLPEHTVFFYTNGKVAKFISSACGIAFVAILETLISAKIAEQKTDWPFSDSRESLGLAISHAVCGVVGSLPPTGVFVRTSLNLQLGATHRLSQIVNAVVVLAISVVAMPVFSYLPQASVAALLVFASVRMAPLGYVKELWDTDRVSCALLLLTCAVCVFSDPVYGLVVGMVLALLRDASETSQADARLTVVHDMHGDAEETGSVSPCSPAKLNRSSSRRNLVVQDFDFAAKVVEPASPAFRAMSFLKKEKRVRRRSETFADQNAAWTDLPDSTVLYEPIGPVAYLAADRHLARMRALLKQRPSSVVISFELVTRVDMDGCETLGKAAKQLMDSGIRVELIVADTCKHISLLQTCWVKDLQTAGRVHDHWSTIVEEKKRKVTSQQPAMFFDKDSDKTAEFGMEIGDDHAPSDLERLVPPGAARSVPSFDPVSIKPRARLSDNIV